MQGTCSLSKTISTETRSLIVKRLSLTGFIAMLAPFTLSAVIKEVMIQIKTAKLCLIAMFSKTILPRIKVARFDTFTKISQQCTKQHQMDEGSCQIVSSNHQKVTKWATWLTRTPTKATWLNMGKILPLTQLLSSIHWFRTGIILKLMMNLMASPWLLDN